MGRLGRKDLTSEERNGIFQFLLEDSKLGKPLRDKILEAATKYGVSHRTNYRIWAAAKKHKDASQVIHLQSKKKIAIHRKRVQIDLSLIESPPMCKHDTIRKLANGITCSKSTVWRWLSQGLIKAHTNAIKPSLTAENKFLRLPFSLEALEFDRILNRLMFKNMHNTVHIDEKWFYMTRASHRTYLTPTEAEPHSSCKSKKFITKVMFMCAVCRPIFAEDGSVVFDGKIGIFPFTEIVPAKKRSKNRAAGTLETKPIQSITKEVVKTCLIHKVVPAIMEKWPPNADRLIFIQQDNARPHIKDSDPEFRAAASQNGFDIRLVHQPPNSPDTNVNDLGWFRAIQSIQIESDCTTVDELVMAVYNSFQELSPITLNKVFISLQGCMMEIMKVKGQNCYRIPHLRKDALIRQNSLPQNLEVPIQLVRECFAYILENGIILEAEELQNQLGI